MPSCAAACGERCRERLCCLSPACWQHPDHTSSCQGPLTPATVGLAVQTHRAQWSDSSVLANFNPQFLWLSHWMIRGEYYLLCHLLQHRPQVPHQWDSLKREPFASWQVTWRQQPSAWHRFVIDACGVNEWTVLANGVIWSLERDHHLSKQLYLIPGSCSHSLLSLQKQTGPRPWVT